MNVNFQNKVHSMEIISHIYKDDKDCWHIQSNEEHLKGVAKLAEGFADEFGMGSWGRALGLLHDKGKERKSFQDYIRQNSGLEPEMHCSLEHNHAFVACNSVSGRLDIFLSILSKGLRWITKG